MIKIISSILLVVFAACTITTAQTSFGITTTYSALTSGAEESYTDLSRRTFSDEIMYQGENRSIGIGVSLYKDFDLLFLRTEVLYTSEEQSYAINEYIRGEGGFEQSSSEYTDTRSQLSVPVIAGFQKHGFQLGAGPVLNFVIDSDRAINTTENITYQDRSVETGYQLYLGYEINKHIVISARFEQSFQTLGNRYRYNNQPMDLSVRPMRMDLGLSLYL